MRKITLQDVPDLIPEMKLSCPNPDCQKEIKISTQKYIKEKISKIKCEHCGHEIDINDTFDKFVEQLNKSGIFRK